MKKELFFASIIFFAILIAGCGSGSGALPAALSGQDYSYDMPAPSGGKGPFICAATPDSAIPAGLNFNGCKLTGTAPTLLGVSEKIFSFKFSIVDSTGKAYGPFDAKLPVSVGPPEFSPTKLPEAGIGMDYAFSFCDNPAALDCTSSYSVSGGAGAPYTFSAAGLPLGLFLSPNGELSGKIPKEAQEGERTFRVCAIDSARVEDCKDVKLSIKKNTALKYRLVLKSTKTYSGEVVNFNYCGGSAKEDGSIIFEIDEVIVLTQPPSSWNQNTPYTSNEYDVITDEYGYTSTDNVRHLQVPMKASGSAATSYDFCEYSTTECNSDSFSASYGIKVPIEMTLDASGLTVYIDNPYVKDNPHLEAGDISQMTCSSPGIAEYILKKMAVESPFVRENSYRKAVFDANGGTLAGQYEDMNPYTYAFGAASGRTSRHLEWTLAVEIIK